MNSGDLYPRFTEREMARRSAAVRTAMQEAGLAALIFYSTASAYQEVLYLSNFQATQEAMLLFPSVGEPTLLVQMFNHVPNARQIACLSDVRRGGIDTANIAASIFIEHGLADSAIGIVGMLPMQRYTALQRGLPQASFSDFSAQFQRLRLVKSEEEIAFLRKGAQLSDRAMIALEREARPGLTEHELVAIIEEAYLSLGGKNHIHYLATTPMHNPTVCVPAQHPSTRILQQGDVLITEISAHYYGYAGQILRPFAIVASPTAAYQHMYEVAVEAFQRIASVIQPGASIDDVLDAAEYIHDEGFTIYDDLLHGFGGGYLPPILRTRRSSMRPVQPFVFQENMTLVIQPNVISEDERMGVQVGELMCVTVNGVESLHRYPMQFVQCK